MSEVTVASTSELPEVAAFYATCGYGGGISQADTVLVSRICGQLVGVSCQRFSPLGYLHTWRVASKFSPCAE